nr:hypothetical protein [Tanacetum cinerariifolium]
MARRAFWVLHNGIRVAIVLYVNEEGVVVEAGPALCASQHHRTKGWDMDLVLAGLESETRVSGYDADNIASAAMGGLLNKAYADFWAADRTFAKLNVVVVDYTHAHMHHKRVGVLRKPNLEDVQHGTGANKDLNVLYGSPLFDDLLTDRAPEAPLVVNGKTYKKVQGNLIDDKSISSENNGLVTQPEDRKVHDDLRHDIVEHLWNLNNLLVLHNGIRVAIVLYVNEEGVVVEAGSCLSLRPRQNLLLTPLGLHGDDVNTKSDGVTLSGKEKPIEDSAG